MACVAENFLYMDQADIKLPHISADGVHLRVVCNKIVKNCKNSGFSVFEIPWKYFPGLISFLTFQEVVLTGVEEKKSKYLTRFENGCHVRDIFCHVRDGFDEVTMFDHCKLLLVTQGFPYFLCCNLHRDLKYSKK